MFVYMACETNSVFLKNPTFPSVSKLIEAAERTNESDRRVPRPSLATRPSSSVRSFLRKRPEVSAVEKS